MVSKEDLLDLTKSQLIDIVKKIKEKLNLSITGKNKEMLVDIIFNLHNKNKFYDKKLLSFGDDAHIKVPKRKIKDPDFEKIEKKRIKKLKETKKGQLKLLQEKFKKIENPTLGQIQQFKAKLRAIEKMN